MFSVYADDTSCIGLKKLDLSNNGLCGVYYDHVEQGWKGQYTETALNIITKAMKKARDRGLGKGRTINLGKNNIKMSLQDSLKNTFGSGIML